jgi:hypothetical protein
MDGDQFGLVEDVSGIRFVDEKRTEDAHPNVPVIRRWSM